MTIKSVTINTILTAFLLISHSYTWTMNHNSLVITKKYLEKFYHADTKKEHVQHIINSGSLETLPSEMLNIVISKIRSLEKKIQTISSLSRTCKKFNKLSLCYELLPYAQTPKMAQTLFNISKVDLKDPKNTNILWNMFFYENEKALEMLEFYIKNNVPLNTINAKNGNSLLHTFIDNICHIKGFKDKAIKAIDLIIDACPELFYITNDQGNNPIERALIHIEAILSVDINEICVQELALYNKVLKALNKKTDFARKAWFSKH